MAGVYWTGANGLTYVRADGVNGGEVMALGEGWDQNQNAVDLINGLERIEDPNPPAPTTTPAPTGGGGGGGGSSTPDPVLNQAAIDNTAKAISSLDTDLSVGYGNIDNDYNSVIGGYDQERARTEADYKEEGVTNTTNLQRNKQNALVSAAQGLRGLRGVLGSIGALSGDGSALANRAVTTEANQDIGGATDTAAGNAKMLDKAWGRFDEEDQDRRREAETTKVNNRSALEGEVAGKRQSMYQKLAELYGEVDDVGNATNWLNQAGDLNQFIAERGTRVATPFSAKTAAWTPGELETYLAGAGDMTVKVRDGGTNGAGGPTTVLAGGQDEEKRRRKLALA